MRGAQSPRIKQGYVDPHRLALVSVVLIVGRSPPARAKRSPAYGDDTATLLYRQTIISLADRCCLPAIYQFRIFVDDSG
jgi:hypothetical protein